MTKEITKSILLQELEDKFKLREFVPAPFLFDETVVPTYDIGPHLVKRTADYKTVSITSATAFLFFTVPATELWHLNAYTVVFMGTGAIKIAGVYIHRDRREQAGVFTYLDLTKNQTVSYTHVLPFPLFLAPKDRIQINVDDYTSTQDLQLYIDYTMEEVR